MRKLMAVLAMLTLATPTLANGLTDAAKASNQSRSQDTRGKSSSCSCKSTPRKTTSSSQRDRDPFNSPTPGNGMTGTDAYY